MKTIDEWAQEVHRNSANHGFWSEHERKLGVETILAKLALIHSEVSEAAECAREVNFSLSNTGWKTATGKPEGFESELADIVIRVFDLAAACGIDIEWAIAEKATYNESRPRLHGKRA